MKIRVYSLCWNEEIIAPYFLKHYKSITNDIVVYDNYSDDNTCEILKECEIRKFDTKGKFRDDIHIEIKNEIWKECKGKYDWVIICDMDELIYCEKIHSALNQADFLGYTAIIPKGYSMVGDKLPTTEGMIYEEINKGKQDNNYSKMSIINPNKVDETNYDIIIKNNWGLHYNFKKEQINKEYEDFKLESSEILKIKKN